MLGLVLDALILVVLLYLLARHDADFSFYKAIILSAALTAIEALSYVLLLSMGIHSFLLPAVAVFGCCVWALVQFFYLQWSKSFLISFLYFISVSVVQYLLSMMTRVP